MVLLPDIGAPCTMTAIPLLLRAAFPSGLKSIPRCLAIAAETGVISNSPTPILLAESCAKIHVKK